MIDDHPQAPNATRSEKVGRLPPKSAIPRLYLLGECMDTFCLRVELAHTGPAPGWKLPVPLGWECLYDIPKNGINDQVRGQFHKLLDSWLDEIQKAPDQHGSRMPCFFTVEFRGDTENWRNTEEELAANTKKLIKDRLNQFVKNRSR